MDLFGDCFSVSRLTKSDGTRETKVRELNHCMYVCVDVIKLHCE